MVLPVCRYWQWELLQCELLQRPSLMQVHITFCPVSMLQQG